MKKVFILMVSGLFIIICAAVFWQWSAFSKNSDKQAEPKDELSVIAAVKVEANQLMVKQTFHGLEENRQYESVIPAQAIGVKCTNSERDSCQDGFTKLPKGKEIQFEYMIKSGPGFSFLLNDWLVVLNDAAISKLRIEVVDQYNRKGTWAAGLPLKGYKQTELLHYYVFEGVNSSPSLYWQDKPLSRLSGQKGIHYYSSDKEQAIYEFASLDRLNDNHLSVVFTDGQRSVQGNGLLQVGNKLTDKELERQLGVALLASKFGIKRGMESLTIETLASLVFKQESQNAKSKAMAAELVNTLSPKEIDGFITYLANERHLDVNSLDKYLSSIKGMTTKFFIKNSQNGQAVFPLLFTDSRQVIVNGKKREELEVLVNDNVHLFPLVPTMAALGYNTNIGIDPTVMELTSASRKYSFDLTNNIFTAGGESFGLLENPFHFINGEWYLEKQWFPGIFKVEISDQDDSIILES